MSGRSGAGASRQDGGAGGGADHARALSVTPNEAARHGLTLRNDGQRRSAFDLLSYPDVGIGEVARIWPQLGELAGKIAEQLEIDAKYAVYLDRQAADIAAYRRDESFTCPTISTMRRARTVQRSPAKLQTHRPRTIGQAGRIDGITPAALTLLVAHLRRQGRNGRVTAADRLTARAADSPRSRPRAELTPVSRETADRLDRFVALLLDWQQR